jgi:hypothetical protein
MGGTLSTVPPTVIVAPEKSVFDGGVPNETSEIKDSVVPVGVAPPLPVRSVGKVNVLPLADEMIIPPT